MKDKLLKDKLLKDKLLKDKLLKDKLLKDKILKVQTLVKKTPEIKNLEKEFKNEMIFYDSIEFNFPFNISDT